MAKKSIKKHCGSFVVMKRGKRYLFSVESSEVKVEDGLVNGYESGKKVFSAPLDNVDCWGGNTVFFKNAWWGKE